jgi:predicted RND superfamily exporter protein
VTLRDRIDTGLERWGRAMVRHRWPVLALCLAFLLCMASLLPLMRLENSTRSYLHGDDPASLRYDEFGERFGQDDHILIALTPAEVFEPRFLESLRELHRALESELPHVTEVTSLVNARRTRGEDDTLVVEELMADWPETPEDLTALRATVFANPLYLDNLISRDGRTTTVTIRPDLYSAAGDDDPLADLGAGFEDEPAGAPAAEPEPLRDEEEAALLAALDEILERAAPPGTEVQVVGGAVMARRVNAMMIADVRAYVTLAGLVIVGLLYALFRRVSGVVFPLVIVVTGLISTLGTMVWIDIPFSLVLGMLPIFTMTVSVCTTVHVLVAVYREIGRGASREEAVAFAFRHSGLAICMASATTAAGMFSFTTAELEPVRHLGIVAPFAVFYAFAFTMVLLPALIALTPLKAEARGDRRASAPPSERLLVWVGAMSVRHSRPVLISALLLLVFLLFGIARLRFAHEPVAWFPEADPLRVAVETIDDVLRGSTSVEVVIDTGEENGLHDPETLRRIEAAMDAAEALSVDAIFVGKAMSLVDIVKESNEALNGGLPEARVIPSSRQLVAQELLLFESGGSDDLEKFSDSRFRLARLSLRLPESDAVGQQRFLAELEGVLDRVLGDELDYVVTGRTTLTARVMSALITSLGKSYAVALLVITPLMMLLAGDPRLGLISMVPNLFPVVFVLGFMGWLEIPLDASNVVIGSVVIGLAVDDTIHFLQRFRREFEGTGSVEEAVRRTMGITGTALLFTSLVLCSGFLAMASRGTMHNTIYFGSLCALGIAFAFLADVVTTPALITETTRRLPRRRGAPLGGAPLSVEGRGRSST